MTFFLLSVTLAVVVGGTVYFVVYRKRNRSRRSLERSWSFTSEGMRLGCFPTSIQAPDTVINSALYFDHSPVPSVEDLAETVVQPLLEYQRFRLVPASTGGIRNSTNENYTATDLIRTIKISSDDPSVLHKAIIDSISPKLHKGRNDLPWWEIVRIENTASPAKNSACVLRVHHCLGDGLSLINIFDKIVTSADGSKMESRITKAMLKRTTSKPPVSSIISATAHVLSLGASKHDDPTAFRPNSDITYSGNRKFLLFPDVPLDFVKELKNKAPTAVTVNDILMFVVSQAIHDYCNSVDDPIFQSKGGNPGSQIQCRALLPASLPRSRSDLEHLPMQNKWCMVSADLHIGYSKPMERLQAIHKTTTFMKSSPRAYIQLWLQNNVAPLLPLNAARQATHDIFSRHSLVLTNIPGPEQTCWLAKQPVSRVQMLFPNVIPQVSLLTYAGTVYGNIVHDPDQMKDDGDTFAAYYAKAYKDLAEVFSVEVPMKIQEAAAAVSQQ